MFEILEKTKLFIVTGTQGWKGEWIVYEVARGNILGGWKYSISDWGGGNMGEYIGQNAKYISINSIKV